MEFFFIMIVLSNAINPFIANTLGVCSNTSTGKPLQCCKNYRQVGEACVECWPGTYGWNCTPCPEGFYGRLCIEPCNNCTPCYPITGCASPESSSGLGDNEWLILLLSVTGTSGVGFAVFIFIFSKFKKKTSKQYHGNQELEKSTLDIQKKDLTTGPKGGNKALMTLQNPNDSLNEESQLVESGPYHTLDLKY